MRITIMVLAAVTVLVWLLYWIAERITGRRNDRLAVGSAIVMRLCLSAAFAILALRAAMRGGYGWIEFAAFALGALVFFVMGGVLIWSAATDTLDGPDAADGD